MKKTLFAILILPIFYSAQAQSPMKWLGQKTDLSHIQEVVNNYHMFGADGKKVGSMVFGFFYDGDKLVARDTSQFDDGSVYETAEFRYSIEEGKLIYEHTAMSTPNADLDVSLTFKDKVAKGNIEVKRSAGEDSFFPIDQKLEYSVVRGEIYMLLHTLELMPGDTIQFSALVTNSMQISEASLYYDGLESITTAMGTYECDVYWLKTDGKMPDNKIWISREPQRSIVKFHVPAAQLDIELVSQRAYEKE